MPHLDNATGLKSHNSSFQILLQQAGFAACIQARSIYTSSNAIFFLNTFYNVRQRSFDSHNRTDKRNHRLGIIAQIIDI